MYISTKCFGVLVKGILTKLFFDIDLHYKGLKYKHFDNRPRNWVKTLVVGSKIKQLLKIKFYCNFNGAFRAFKAKYLLQMEQLSSYGF